MRITQGMMATHVLQNLMGNMRRLDRLNDQLSSGKEIRLPSHDPARIARSYDLRRSLNETARYDANLRDALAWLNATEAALNEATTIMQRARELTVRGADGTLPDEARKAIADEIEQLIEALLQVADSEHEGRKLFAGFRVNMGGSVFRVEVQTDDKREFRYQGDFGQHVYRIGPQADLVINVLAADAENADDQDPSTATGGVFLDALNALESVRYNLSGAGDPTQVGSTDLAALDDALDRLISARSVTGARTNRVEMADMRMKEFSINLRELLSKNEDVEIEEKVMELAMQEYAYRVALQVGARVLQPNLADYLR